MDRMWRGAELGITARMRRKLDRQIRKCGSGIERGWGATFISSEPISLQTSVCIVTSKWLFKKPYQSKSIRQTITNRSSKLYFQNAQSITKAIRSHQHAKMFQSSQAITVQFDSRDFQQLLLEEFHLTSNSCVFAPYLGAKFQPKCPAP